MFQPLSGPGFRVNKRTVTVEQLRAEILQRVAGLPGAGKIAVPPIVPADRGRHVANWTVEDWTGVPQAQRPAVEAAVATLKREIEVEEI